MKCAAQWILQIAGELIRVSFVPDNAVCLTKKVMNFLISVRFVRSVFVSTYPVTRATALIKTFRDRRTYHSFPGMPGVGSTLPFLRDVRIKNVTVISREARNDFENDQAKRFLSLCLFVPGD